MYKRVYFNLNHIVYDVQIQLSLVKGPLFCASYMVKTKVKLYMLVGTARGLPKKILRTTLIRGKPCYHCQSTGNDNSKYHSFNAIREVASEYTELCIPIEGKIGVFKVKCSRKSVKVKFGSKVLNWSKLWGRGLECWNTKIGSWVSAPNAPRYSTGRLYLLENFHGKSNIAFCPNRIIMSILHAFGSFYIEHPVSVSICCIHLQR